MRNKILHFDKPSQPSKINLNAEENDHEYSFIGIGYALRFIGILALIGFLIYKYYVAR